MSMIIDFGEEPIRCQPVPARTSIPEREPVRATSYRAESLELGNYSHCCRVRLNALLAPRVDIAIEFGPDHPSRYTVAGHDIREMSTPFNNHDYRMSHWLQDQQSAMDHISRVPDYESLNQHRVSPVNLSPPPRTETPIVSMSMQRASPPKSPSNFSQWTCNEFPKATENQSPKQEANVMEFPSPDQSTLSKTNMLILVEKLIDTQQATEQVLKTMVTTSQNQVIMFSNVENSVPTFAGDSTQDKAEAWLNSLNNAALSLNMPVESKLNFCDLYLTGAAKFWYNRVVAQKTVTTWPEFEDAYKRTYCKGVSKDMLYRQMLTVMQYMEESLEVYFQKKACVCNVTSSSPTRSMQSSRDWWTLVWPTPLWPSSIPTLRKSGIVSRSMREWSDKEVGEHTRLPDI
jgi:hypothetical protein